MKKIYYLGPELSYSHMAAQKYQKEQQLEPVVLTSQPSITTIFDEVDRDGALGIVPLENSTSGDVYETYQALRTKKYSVIGELILPIHHQLIVKKETRLDEIRTVYSHPQALMQVSKFTQEYGLQTVATASTADACLMLERSEDLSIAAIASKESVAQLDHLEVLPIDVSNHEENYTRFLVISRGEKTDIKQQYHQLFLLFELSEDKAGGLSNILQILASFQINMTSIKSRPLEGEKFQYYFVIEAQVGKLTIADHQAVKTQLESQTSYLNYCPY